MAKKIAVVDDSPAIVEQLQLLLEQEGYEVYPIIGSAGAFDQIKRVHPDLVFLDIMMPGQSGWEVLDMLRFDTETQDIPIIILTGVKGTASRQLGGQFVVIRKPYDTADLLTKVADTIGKP